MTTQRSATAVVARRTAVVLASVASAASIVAAVDGSTGARLLVAIVLPLAVGAWLGSVGRARPSVSVLAVLALLFGVGSVHVTLTSPTAAWMYDGHMVQPAVLSLLPSGGVRLAVAWAVPLLWTATFAATAAAAHRRAGMPVVALLVLGVGGAPLVVAASFPTDAYLLLWNRTALGHLSYTVGVLAVLALTALVPRDSLSGRTSMRGRPPSDSAR